MLFLYQIVFDANLYLWHFKYLAYCGCGKFFGVFFGYDGKNIQLLLLFFWRTSYFSLILQIIFVWRINYLNLFRLFFILFWFRLTRITINRITINRFSIIRLSIIRVSILRFIIKRRRRKCIIIFNLLL